MPKKITFFTFMLACGAQVGFAQTSPLFEMNKNYRSGIELLDKEKYGSAAQQFRLVEQSRTKPSGQTLSAAEATLLRENAQFYIALCALELGNDDAEALFGKFLKEAPLNPNTKLAYFYMGRAYFDQKNYKKAVEWFGKTDPDNLSGKQSAEFRFKQAYSYFELNDFDKAEPVFEKLKEQENAYKEPSTYYFAYINYLNKDYKTALRNFERLKGSKTYERSYPYYITAMYFFDKRYDDVISYAIPVLESTKQENETEMFRIVAASYFAKADYPNTEKYYRKFQDQDKGQTINNQDYYQFGYTLYQLKKYDEAIVSLEKIGKDDVYAQNGMYTLGMTFLKVNKKQNARSAFERASKIDKDKQIQEDALLNYAKLSYELEFHQQALEATQNFLKMFPQSTKQNEAKTLLGEVLLSTKNYQAAIDILETIPNKNKEAREAYQKVTYYRGLEFYNERAFPNAISAFLRANNNVVDEEIHALTVYWMAEAMYELRKFGESVSNFEKFLKMPEAQDTKVYNFANYALAYAAFEDEKYTKAATYFERFLNGNEKDQNTINDAIMRLADSYFVMKHYDNALSNYNKIIATRAKGEDYALFQRGMIQGLTGQPDAKISTMESLLKKYPASNYADDAGFERAYTYFVKGDFDRSKTDLEGLIVQYPRSSYVPKALVTIGLVQINQDKNDDARETFKRVIKDYPTTDEAKQALESVKNIYMDKNDANGFLTYANTTPIGNYSMAEQDNIMFQSAVNLFQRGDYKESFEAINAYFDKFPKPVHDKQAKFIRAESLVKLDRPNEAVADYEYILNDWTSDYTEKSLLSISKLYLAQKKYNEAIVYLKKLETTAEYKSNYGFAINNLLRAYSELNMPDDMLKYVQLIKEYEKSSEEEKFSASLYSGKAYLLKGDTEAAMKDFQYVVDKTKTVAAAEAKYNIALLQYKKGEFKTSQKTCFEVINKMPAYDYWVAKAFILLSDNYLGLKDEFQAKSTLQSIIENYDGKDDILPTAKEKLEKLNPKKK